MPYCEVYKDSRKVTADKENITADYVFVVWDNGDFPDYGTDPFWGDNEELEALEYANITIPIVRAVTFAGITYIVPRTQLEISQRTDTHYEVKVTYTTDEEQEDDTCKLSYNTSGESVNVTQSLLEIESDSAFGVANPPPDSNQVIGIARDRIEGAEIEEAGLDFQVTYYLDSSIAHTFAFMNVLYVLTKTVNLNALWGFAVGELLFRGANAEGSFGAKVSITLDFKAIANINGKPDGLFPPLTKLGHELLVYTYDDAFRPTENEIVRQPSYRYIHQVYEWADFTPLGFPC